MTARRGASSTAITTLIVICRSTGCLRPRLTGPSPFGQPAAGCLAPLCGDIPLWAQLRTADRDGTLEAQQKIIPAIRDRFGKRTAILVRGDSGFCREPIMAWIEAQQGVHYILGLARDSRLEAMLEPAFWQTAAQLDEEAVLFARASGAHSPPELEGTARKRAGAASAASSAKRR